MAETARGTTGWNIEVMYVHFSTLIEEHKKQFAIALANQKEYFEHILAEMDKRYMQRFDAQEKAVAKAEQAQSDYNIRSNEFRGQLDDQAKMLMPRAEADQRFKASEDKTDQRFKAVDEKIEINRNEVAGLRESRSGYAVRDASQDKARARDDWKMGIWIAIGLGLLSLVFQAIKMFK